MGVRQPFSPPRLAPLSRRRRRAVTLMEILVVVVILSLMMALSIPTLRGVHSRNKLTAAAREFATLARLARQQAVLRDYVTEIRVQPEKGLFWLDLTPPSKSGGRLRSSIKRDREDMEKKRNLDAKHGKIVFEEMTTAAEDVDRRREEYKRIRFFRNGSATPATVLIADTDGHRMTVIIAASTGSVRAYKGAPKVEEFPEEKTAETTERGVSETKKRFRGRRSR